MLLVLPWLEPIVYDVQHIVLINRVEQEKTEDNADIINVVKYWH